MNAMKSTLALAAALAVLFTSPGCDDSGGEIQSVGGSATPPVGSHVDVQFRRNYMGLASSQPTTPMGQAGMELGSSGILKGITNDFVVLQVHGEENRELWIPRDTILLLDVKRVK